MLNQDIKRKIDSARDILVGKVPDPKAQVEQITTALIYKFMDDMDKESVSLPKGKAQFFTNGYEKYAWNKLMDPRLGGHERLNLYVEAITRMSQNPHLPQLFRDIFKDAFLPYRDPETLSLFLKEINGFTYDHSENLGDAFEYLLSILGSQGEAGQFRTPRHIIDFIVEVVDPKKDETIVDPACGTAGFLISAYKHILKANKEKPLTPDEKKELMNNLIGYDISPDMVKLSLVNMYLHGFPSPHIYEYDTLTSEEHWDDQFDVIMANPPFMTPKGGIKPHKRFSIRAKRSELLFVDYIYEHLNPNGRGGVIVPEGVVFHSGGSYKSLRKLIVQNSLVAVISLPKGVFNPYSGVKTSILILDKITNKRTKDIVFINIRNDGFDLGAQRNPIKENDIPQAVHIMKKYMNFILNGENFRLTSEEAKIINIVPKEKIENNGKYDLTYNRYLKDDFEYKGKWPLVELSEIADFVRGPFGSSIKKSVCVPKGGNTYKVYEQGNVIHNDFSIGEYYIELEKFIELKRFELKAKDIVVTCAGTLGRIAIVPDNIEPGIINSVLMRIRLNRKRINDEFFIYLFQSDIFQKRILKNATGAGIANMFATKELKGHKIPLPPLELQEKLIKEIKSHNKRIKQYDTKINEEEKNIEKVIESIWK